MLSQEKNYLQQLNDLLLQSEKSDYDLAKVKFSFKENLELIVNIAKKIQLCFLNSHFYFYPTHDGNLSLEWELLDCDKLIYNCLFDFDKKKIELLVVYIGSISYFDHICNFDDDFESELNTFLQKK